MDVPAIRFEVNERGWLDFETGRLRTDSGGFTVSDGPFAGLTIIGDQFDDDQCDASVALGAFVLGSATSPPPSIPAGSAPKKVWICPNTRVALLWDSTNADNVDITPSVGHQPPSGFQVIPDLTAFTNPDLQRPIDRDMDYTARTIGSCRVAEDEVKIEVVRNGDEIDQTASYLDGFTYWTAQLPAHTYDESIRVEAIYIDTTRPDSVRYANWRVDHTYPGEAPTGTTIGALDTWVNTAGYHTLPGEYRFSALPFGTLPTDDLQRTLYFKLRLRCTVP